MFIIVLVIVWTNIKIFLLTVIAVLYYNTKKISFSEGEQHIEQPNLQVSLQCNHSSLTCWFGECISFNGTSKSHDIETMNRSRYNLLTCIVVVFNVMYVVVFISVLEYSFVHHHHQCLELFFFQLLLCFSCDSVSFSAIMF